MRLYIVFLSFIISLATAEALRLWDGHSWINSTYEPLDEWVDSALSLAPRAGKGPCKGSVRCKDCCVGHSLKEIYGHAQNLINDQKEYFTGGKAEETGVCTRASWFTQACGIFIKKKGKNECRILGRDMRAKVLELRALKCEKGGRLPMDGDDSCEVRVDYVNNCKTKVPDANIWD